MNTRFTGKAFCLKALSIIFAFVCMFSCIPQEGHCQERGSINGYYVDQIASSTLDALYDKGILTSKEYKELKALAQPLPADPRLAGPGVIDIYTRLGEIFIERGIASSYEIEAIKHQAVSSFGLKIAGADPVLYSTLMLQLMVNKEIIPLVHGQYILDTARAELIIDGDSFLGVGLQIFEGLDAIGDLLDPQMNPNYVALKKREIGRLYEELLDSKRRYEETPWYRPFARYSRKKALYNALEDYLDGVESFAQSKVGFHYDVYVNTSGIMSWRKPFRKQKWMNSLMEYSYFILGRADYKLDWARQEYENESWWCFWSKLAKKKVYEQAQKEHQEALRRVEDIWLDAGIISKPTAKSLKTADGTDAGQLNIKLEKKDDM